MRYLRITLWLAALLPGCVGSTGDCVDGARTAPATATTASAPFRSSTDPFESGPLEVARWRVAACEQGSPASLLICAPRTPGTYAVVLFQHGFMSRNDYYAEILQRVASHGFIVVAPQMYEPGIGPLFGNPTAAEEADLARRIVEWLPAHLSEICSVNARTDLLGLAGHSRSGKVAWAIAQAAPRHFRAIAGVDPVDGTGGPRGNQPRVIDGPVQYAFPSLVVGTELGGDCAPQGDNHEQFYGAAPPPAWHLIVLDAGHGDMLDESAARAAAQVCASGASRAAMRRLTAGVLVGFFRGSMLDDGPAYSYLTSAGATGLQVRVEIK